jgi:hypothetical protein
VLSNVFAHAHLAAVGWAVMMVVARLPAAADGDTGEAPADLPYASAVLMEIGV